MNTPILCIGELLIDFFCNEVNTNLKDGQSFTKKAGGAPANVCATISRLGGIAYFSGKVGADPFGDFLETTLKDVGVNTRFLVKDPSHSTTLAFVSLTEDGQRDFVFNRGADAYLAIDEFPIETLDSMKMVHFGSATALLPGPFQHTYLEVLKVAKQKSCFTSFDPNFRSDLWKGKEKDFVELTLQCIAYCDFLKVSEEELMLLTNESDINKAIIQLHLIGAKFIAVTLGKNGTCFSNNEETFIIESIPIKAIDSTGAGDAFVGAALYQLSLLPDTLNTTLSQWKDIIQFSNKVGAIVCEKMGAIESLPTLDEVSKR
ncbi:carbohydrate kinase [Ureibacillus sp. NPDC094379]